MRKATRLDHVAIAVRDIDAGIDKWMTLLGAELVEKQKITLQGRKVEAALPQGRRRDRRSRRRRRSEVEERIGRLKRFLRTQGG